MDSCTADRPVRMGVEAILTEATRFVDESRETLSGELFEHMFERRQQ